MGPTSSSIARSMSVPGARSPRRRARRNGARSRSCWRARNSAPKRAATARSRGAFPAAARRAAAGLESARDGGVVLGLPGQGPAARAGVSEGQEGGELPQVVAQVAAELAVIGRGEVLVGVDRQGLEEDVGLGMPPA